MAERNGISKLDLKRLNRKEILRLIIRYGAMSRIDISKKLHLTRAAVTIITNEMISQGMIYEKGEQKQTGERNPRGRKKILIDIHENYKFSFGIVLDRGQLHIGLANLRGQTLDRRIFSIEERSLQEVVELAYENANEILANNCLTTTNLLGLAACVSESAIQLFEQDKKNDLFGSLKKLLEMRFQLPVVVQGTTESLAIAEIVFHTNFGEKPSNMVFLRYEYELDAAIMLDGEIYRGGQHRSGWFSHIVVDTQGERCHCGKIGCCGTKMSIDGIIDKIKQLYEDGKTPLLYEATGGNVNKVDFSAEGLKLLLQEKAVFKLYEEALEYLTTALDNLLTVLEPDKIVLYGFVFRKILDLEMLTDKMEKEHNHRWKDRVVLSRMQSSSLHLAGNGLCVKQFFIDQGGL